MGLVDTPQVETKFNLRLNSLPTYKSTTQFADVDLPSYFSTNLLIPAQESNETTNASAHRDNDNFDMRLRYDNAFVSTRAVRNQPFLVRSYAVTSGSSPKRRRKIEKRTRTDR